MFSEKGSKLCPVFDSLLEALWGSLGRRSGSLGPLLGDVVFQIPYKNLYKNVHFQKTIFSLSYLTWSRLSGFYVVFGPKKGLYMLIRIEKRVPDLGPFFELACDRKFIEIFCIRRKFPPTPPPSMHSATVLV